MANINADVIRVELTTEASAAGTLKPKMMAYAKDTRRSVWMEGDNTLRYAWDSTRLADQGGTYGTAVIGSAGITGITPNGGSSGSAATLANMLTGIRDSVILKSPYNTTINTIQPTADYVPFTLKGFAAGVSKLLSLQTSSTEVAWFDNAANLTLSRSDAGSNVAVSVLNSNSLNAASNALILLSTGGSGSGDPYLRHNVSGVQDWAAGVDTSDGRKYKIAASSTLGAGNDWVSITPAGAVSLPGILGVTGVATFSTASISRFATIGSTVIRNANPALGDSSKPHILEVVNDGSTTDQLMSVSTYGDSATLASQNNLHWNRYRGSLSSPSAILAGDVFMSMGFRGFDGTSLSQSAAGFHCTATENFSTSHMGTMFDFQCTPTGTNTRNTIIQIDGTGIKSFGVIQASAAGSGSASVRSYGVGDADAANNEGILMIHGGGFADIGSFANGTGTYRPFRIKTNGVVGFSMDTSQAITMAGAVTVGSLSVTGAATLASDLVFSSTNSIIRTNTADGSDNKAVFITAGGAYDGVGTRGASIAMLGNEYAATGGAIAINAGQMSTAFVDIVLPNNVADSFSIEDHAGNEYITIDSLTSAKFVGVKTDFGLGGTLASLSALPSTSGADCPDTTATPLYAKVKRWNGTSWDKIWMNAVPNKVIP